MASLLGDMMLYESSFRRALSFLPRFSRRSASLVSTDLHPFLEYQTPKGNALTVGTIPVNMRFLQSLRPPPLPPDLPIRNLPSEDERNLILGYITTERGESPAAVEYFRRVEGPARVRARAEMARIISATREKRSPSAR